MVSNGYKLLPVEGYPFFKLITSPIYGINAFLKRVFDIFFSVVLIILTLPLYLVIPVLIKVDSRGPVFFSQIRLGLNGKPFKIVKFRSMFEGAEDEVGDILLRTIPCGPADEASAVLERSLCDHLTVRFQDAVRRL